MSDVVMPEALAAILAEERFGRCADGSLYVKHIGSIRIEVYGTVINDWKVFCETRKSYGVLVIELERAASILRRIEAALGEEVS